MDEPVLSIRGLVTEFSTPDGIVHAVDGVSYDVHPGETVGIVGESGSGKSVTVLSVLGLVPQPPGRIVAGEAFLGGEDLLAASPDRLRAIRGKDIAMVFQDPMTSLNPVLRVGAQIVEALQAHDRDLSDAGARDRALELLGLVGLPNPDRTFAHYPHEYSGGMRQRAMIAMAIANEPRILVADEPTTALDVTVQAQVLAALRRAQAATNAGLVLITHDLGLIAEMADRVVVMYAGKVVETADVRTVFHEPRHPYTLGLLASLPRLDTDFARLAPIEGQPPSLLTVPEGCAFRPRCRLWQGRERCRREEPPLYPAAAGHRSACHFHDELAAEAARVSREIGADPTPGPP